MENNEYPEPTIDIVINDKAVRFNGNYKKGVIEEFMANYTTTIRSGRRKEIKYDTH